MSKEGKSEEQRAKSRVRRVCSIVQNRKAPMHKGVAGTANLNQALQKALNPGSVRRDGRFNIEDKVMHLKNNYQKEVFNGDIGTITSIDTANSRLSVDYYGRIVAYDFAETEELSLAYAIRIDLFLNSF